MDYEVIIIGGGAAALTSAIYTSRKAHKTLVIAKQLGGQTAWAVGIENYPGFEKIDGVELIFKIKDQAIKLGAEINEGETAKEIDVLGKNEFVVKTNKGKYKAKALIIATGKRPRKLGVQGEEKYLGQGVAYCATCDAPLFKDKDVVVAGGGNAGLDAAMELLKYVNKVSILERELKFRGDKTTLDKLKINQKVELISNAQIKEIIGDKTVNRLTYFDKNKKEVSLDVHGVFVEIGSVPVSEFLPKEIKINKNGEIEINHKTQSTNVEGIFAAGDVTDNLYKQTIIAAGDAAKAAISVSEHLKQNK